MENAQESFEQNSRDEKTGPCVCWRGGGSYHDFDWLIYFFENTPAGLRIHHKIMQKEAKRQYSMCLTLYLWTWLSAKLEALEVPLLAVLTAQ